MFTSANLGNNFQNSTNIYTTIIPTANAFDPKISYPSQNSEPDKSRILIHQSKSSKQKQHVRKISTKSTNTAQQQTYIASKYYAVCFVGNSKCKYRNVTKDIHPQNFDITMKIQYISSLATVNYVLNRSVKR